MERWQSVTEIAIHLGISKETVYRWLEQSKIPGHKIGRLWKFRISEVDSWVVADGASEDGLSVATHEANGKTNNQHVVFKQLE